LDSLAAWNVGGSALLHSPSPFNLPAKCSHSTILFSWQSEHFRLSKAAVMATEIRVWCRFSSVCVLFTFQPQRKLDEDGEN
jgi:hypothetical protein